MSRKGEAHGGFSGRLPGWPRDRDQDGGTFKVRPTCKRRASTDGLAAISASSLIPYRRAMPVGVSPVWMVWVRRAVAVASLTAELRRVAGAETAPAGRRAGTLGEV